MNKQNNYSQQEQDDQDYIQFMLEKKGAVPDLNDLFLRQKIESSLEYKFFIMGLIWEESVQLIKAIFTRR